MTNSDTFDLELGDQLFHQRLVRRVAHHQVFALVRCLDDERIVVGGEDLEHPLVIRIS